MVSNTNTLSGRKETFNPRTPGEVSMYVCGVTPYDSTHLGHARPAVVFDVIRKYLSIKGYKVRLIQNFTDVDDKIIARAESNMDPLALFSVCTPKSICRVWPDWAWNRPMLT